MMDDEHMDDELFGEELRAAVRRLEGVDLPVDDVRARAAARMRAAHAAHRAGAPIERRGADAELLTVVAEEPGGRATPRWLTLAAAAAVLVGILAVGLLLGNRETPEPADRPPTTSLPAPLPVVPRALGIGGMTTDVLGPELSLVTDDPLWLLRAERGVVELGLGPPEDDPSTLTIVRPDGLSPALDAESLEALFDSMIGPEEQPNSIAGRSGLSWRIGRPGATDLCVDAACVPLFDEPGSVDLTPDRTTDIFEVPLGGGQVGVLIVASRTEDFAMRFGGPFGDVIATIEIADGDVDPPWSPQVHVAGDVTPG